MFSLGIIIFFSSFMLEYLALLQQLECLALLQQFGPVRNFFVTHSGDDFVPTIWKKCCRMLGLGLTQCWGYAVWVVRDDLRAAVAIMSCVQSVEIHIQIHASRSWSADGSEVGGS